MKRYYEMLDLAYMECSFSNKKTILALELEEEVLRKKTSFTSGPFPYLEEPIIKEYLPSIYNFERHEEWNVKNDEVINEYLKNAAYSCFILKGYEKEKLIDSNVSIRTLMAKNADHPNKDEVLRELYFHTFNKLIVYAEHLNGIVISLLFDTVMTMNDYNYGFLSSRYVECVLFVYGLYVELLEKYDPHKIQPF